MRTQLNKGINYKHKTMLDIISSKVDHEQLIDKESYFILGFTVGRHTSNLMKVFSLL